MAYIAFGFLIFSATICMVIAVYSYINKLRANSMIFSIIMLCVTSYILGFAFEIISTNIKQIMMCLKIQYIGLSFIPAVCIIMAFQARDINGKLKKILTISSILLSVITLVFVLTNEYHHLYYKALTFTQKYSLSITKVTPGFWYYIYIVYLDSSLLYVSICYIKAFFRVKTEVKRQYVILSLGSLSPWLGHILYITGHSPCNIDLSPFSMMLLAILYFYGFFYDKSFNFVSLARNKVFDNMNEMVLVIDSKNCLLDYNNSAKEIIKDADRHVIGKNIFDFFKDSPEFIDYINQNRIGHMEINFQNKDEKYFKINVSPIRGKKDKTLGKVIVFNDITEQVKMMNVLDFYAKFDGLTGLYNRVSFFNCARDLIKDFNGNEFINLIILDIDNFKMVNDIYGHQAGDEVIKTFANIIKDTLMKDYIAGRYGGEEFVILIPHAKLHIAFNFAEKLRKKIEQAEICYEHEKIKVTASFGIASNEFSGKIQLEGLLRQADLALYSAKKKAKNIVEIYHNM